MSNNDWECGIPIMQDIKNDPNEIESSDENSNINKTKFEIKHEGVASENNNNHEDNASLKTDSSGTNIIY